MPPDSKGDKMENNTRINEKFEIFLEQTQKQFAEIEGMLKEILEKLEVKK